MKLVFLRVINRLFLDPTLRRIGVPLETRIARITRRGGDRYN